MTEAVSVINGSTVQLQLGSYEGRAGFVDKGGTANLAYPARRAPNPGDRAMVDGQAWTVLSGKVSGTASQLVVVTVQREES